MTRGRTRTDNIPVEELRQIIDYDPETGVCTWKTNRGTKIRPGMVAGCKNSLGYYFIGINGRRYYTHRIAFALMTGEWPTVLVDHIDMDTTNNAWSNLRLATKAENMCNRGRTRKNKAGAKGVYEGEPGVYRVEITMNGKRKRIGRFGTVEEAAAAYDAAAKVIHGEFAKTNS